MTLKTETKNLYNNFKKGQSSFIIPSQVRFKNSEDKLVKKMSNLELNNLSYNYKSIETKNFHDLGNYVLLNYEVSKISSVLYIHFIFETDTREAKVYKTFKNKSYRYIIGIKGNVAEDFLKDKSKTLQIEKKLLSEVFKIKADKQVIRPSGRYLEFTNTYNGSLAIFGYREDIIDLRNRFEPTDKENFIGILNIAFDNNFKNDPLNTIVGIMKNDSEYSKLDLTNNNVRFKHHFKYLLKRINDVNDFVFKSNKYIVPYLLVLVKKSNDNYDIDLPGGKRELGETSWFAALRELEEESGIKGISKSGIIVKDNSKKIEVDKMDIYINTLF